MKDKNDEKYEKELAEIRKSWREVGVVSAQNGALRMLEKAAKEIRKERNKSSNKK